ncbi:helix-turn-helix transcriptional regulator [Chitinimonas sp. PSY-7]|uniref:helix-turn-helix domain-containing protein n=1 Tax=Chitinimonas sp. PSY-7 TaxID=3459088 RepID=UPI00403FFE83
MNTLHIILGFQVSQIRIADAVHPVNGPSVMLLTTEAPVEATTPGVAVHSFSPAQVLPVYRDMQHLLGPALSHCALSSVHEIPAGIRLLNAAEQLATADINAMLHFVLSYCLAVDAEYSAALLHKLVRGDSDLFDFMNRNRLQPWSVARYAEELGLSLRKFNQLFYEKYGVSPKHWLLEQRLNHARELLVSTTSKIIDIALESGFCSHAHFSDSFRKHFQMSPSEIRRDSGFIPAPTLP